MRAYIPCKTGCSFLKQTQGAVFLHSYFQLDSTFYCHPESYSCDLHGFNHVLSLLILRNFLFQGDLKFPKFQAPNNCFTDEEYSAQMVHDVGENMVIFPSSSTRLIYTTKSV
jgi:hypothetical protein